MSGRGPANIVLRTTSQPIVAPRSGWGEGRLHELIAVEAAGDARAGHLERSLVAPATPATEAPHQVVGVGADGMVKHERRQPVGQWPDLPTMLLRELPEPGPWLRRD